MKIFLGIVVSWLITVASFASTEALTFFQASSKASIAKLHDNNYVLSFTNHPLFINYFTKTKAGAITLTKYLTLWKTPGNFSERPPHAMLGIVTLRNEQIHASVLVTNPSYSNGTITYQITTNKVPLTPGQLKHIVLIFDTLSLNLDNI